MSNSKSGTKEPHLERLFQDSCAEQGSASGTATEHATSKLGTKEPRLERMFQEACVEQTSASGTATEHASSASGPKEPRLERMFQEACDNTSQKLQSLLQQVNTLGHYPKRYKEPADKAEKVSDSLAKKLTTAKSLFCPAAQKYLEAMQAASTAM